MTRILAIGATGQVGTALLPLLRAAGHEVRAQTRRPEGQAGLAAQGVEPVVADPRCPGDLAASFAWAEAVFLLSADAPDQDRVECGLIDAAAAAGAPHLVKLSAQSAGLQPPRSFGIQHRRAETALADSGLPWTVLRPTFFQQSLLLFADDIAAKGKFVAPAGQGRIAMVDVADIAAAAAAVLGAPAHRGQCYTLTGPAAPTMAEIAAMLSEMLGRQVRFSSPPAFVARLVLPFVTGMPRWQSNLVVDLFQALQAGAQATVLPDLAELIGRPPGRVEAFLHRNLDRFRG